MALPTTSAQTIGPFFAILLPLGGNHLVPEDHPDAIHVEGRVLDGEGAPVTDALLEVWQANPDGHYAHPDDAGLPAPGAFTGFGRAYTDAEGRYHFRTLKPGPVPGPGELKQAPHLTLTIFARGLLHRLVTRLYFPDEPAANATDPVLASIEDDAIRATLIAHPEPTALRFDIHLQGPHETAFLDV